MNRTAETGPVSVERPQPTWSRATSRQQQGVALDRLKCSPGSPTLRRKQRNTAADLEFPPVSRTPRQWAVTRLEGSPAHRGNSSARQRRMCGVAWGPQYWGPKQPTACPVPVRQV